MSARIRKNKAQSILEYAVLVGMIAVAFTAMQVYMRRAVDSNIAKLDKEMQTKNIITPCSHNPCDANACSPENCCNPDPCASNPCDTAGNCCNPASPNYVSDPCVNNPCLNAGSCCDPASPNYDAQACCTSDPCTDNPCENAGKCCDQASAYYSNDPCAADHCDNSDCCSDVCNSNACSPAPSNWCLNDRSCTTNPCLSWEQNTSYCASECSTCKDNCDDKVYAECLAGCDRDKLLICNNVVYGQCIALGRESCNYSSQNTACCNACSGACASSSEQISQLPQGTFMLAGGFSTDTAKTQGSFTLAEDLPNEDEVCYRNCMASVTTCVANYVASCTYSCTSFTVGSSITLAGCSGNVNMRDELLECLSNYAYGYYSGICGVYPPTERSCCAQRCTYALVGLGITRVEVCYASDCGHSYGWLDDH